MDRFTAQLVHGELTFDHEGNPLLVKKVKLDDLPKVVNDIQVKQYFIDDATYHQYRETKQQEENHMPPQIISVRSHKSIVEAEHQDLPTKESKPLSAMLYPYQIKQTSSGQTDLRIRPNTAKLKPI